MNDNQYLPLSTKQNKKVSNGKWTKSQHERFMRALEKYGRDWVIVQRFVKTRTLSQVRSHAQKVFLKMSQEDIEAMISGQNDVYCVNVGNVATAKKQKKTQVLKPTNTKIERTNIKCQVKFKETLLDIFKRAIQLQTLQLNNDSNATFHASFQQEHIKQSIDQSISRQDNALSSSSFENYDRKMECQNNSKKLQQFSQQNKIKSQEKQSIQLIQFQPLKQEDIQMRTKTLIH